MFSRRDAIGCRNSSPSGGTLPSLSSYFGALDCDLCSFKGSTHPEGWSVRHIHEITVENIILSTAPRRPEAGVRPWAACSHLSIVISMGASFSSAYLFHQVSATLTNTWGNLPINKNVLDHGFKSFSPWVIGIAAGACGSTRWQKCVAQKTA